MEPKIIYGTAWKGQKTASLVEMALKKGFRALDTACQPKHYQEDLVGEGIKASGLARSELFLQTKYTSPSGQDLARIPYNPNDEIPKQVEDSLKRSLQNLNTDYLDSWLLHGPLETFAKTLEAWTAMESGLSSGQVRQIGLSNVYSLDLLKALFAAARIKPKVLQNRFYKETNFDDEIRRFCKLNDIAYQSFWTLTANPQILQNPEMIRIAHHHQKTPPQIFFNYLNLKGITALTGTTDEWHMMEDLQFQSFELTPMEIKTMDQWIPH